MTFTGHTAFYFLVRILVLASLLICGGCTVLLVDHANQYTKSQKFAVPTSQYAQLDVPFVAQSENYCGPASLSMVAAYHGHNVSQEKLAQLTFIPEKQGTLQTSMVAATRSLGLVPFVTEPSVNQLILEVQSGHPVIVLQNLGIRFYPRWHYAVVVGYDTDAKTFLLHSGERAFTRISMDKLQRTHYRAGRWALIVLPPGNLPAHAEPHQVLQAGLDMESIGQQRIAQQTYLAGVERWPDSFTLQLGLANSYMQLNQPLNASKAYRKALRINGHSAEALNNYAYSVFELGCQQTAVQAAQCAVQMDKTNNPSIAHSVEDLLQRSPNPHNAKHCPRIKCPNITSRENIIASRNSRPTQ